MKNDRLPALSSFGASQILAAIFAAGLILRISGLTASAIWYDEALAFEAAKLPFWSMIEATRYTFSPPVWEVLLWISLRLFGQNELALRLPALLAGGFLLWLSYQVAADFRLSRNQRLVVLAFAALLPYQIAMAQDGRMYTILSVLYLSSLWFALRNRWLGLTGCSGLLLYTHYTAPFYLVAIYIIVLLNNFPNWKRIFTICVSGAVASLSFLPWVGSYISTLHISSPVPSLSPLRLLIMFYQISFEEALNGTGLLFAALAAILVTSLLASILFVKQLFGLLRVVRFKAADCGTYATRRRLIRYLQLTLFGLLPFMIMIIWSLIWENFIYYRLLAAMVIPMIIWTVYTFAQVSPTPRLNAIFLSIWAVLILAGVLFRSPQAKGGDLKDIASMINEQWQEGDIIYHITGTSYLPFSQYLGDKPEYLINETQHEWLLPAQLQDSFGIQNKPLEAIPYKRAWIFFSRDELVSEQAHRRALRYIQNATLIGVVKAWRFNRIEVYLLTLPIRP